MKALLTVLERAAAKTKGALATKAKGAGLAAAKTREASGAPAKIKVVVPAGAGGPAEFPEMPKWTPWMAAQAGSQAKTMKESSHDPA